MHHPAHFALATLLSSTDNMTCANDCHFASIVETLPVYDFVVRIYDKHAQLRSSIGWSQSTPYHGYEITPVIILAVHGMFLTCIGTHVELTKQHVELVQVGINCKPVYVINLPNFGYIAMDDKEKANSFINTWENTWASLCLVKNWCKRNSSPCIDVATLPHEVFSYVAQAISGQEPNVGFPISIVDDELGTATYIHISRDDGGKVVIHNIIAPTKLVGGKNKELLSQIANMKDTLPANSTETFTMAVPFDIYDNDLPEEPEQPKQPKQPDEPEQPDEPKMTAEDAVKQQELAELARKECETLVITPPMPHETKKRAREQQADSTRNANKRKTNEDNARKARAEEVAEKELLRKEIEDKKLKKKQDKKRKSLRSAPATAPAPDV